MSEILIAVVVFTVAMLGLGIGVIARGKPIKGSCGGCADCVTKKKQVP